MSKPIDHGDSIPGPTPLPFASGALIGMVHLLPLPATPRWPSADDASGAIRSLVDAAVADATALATAGYDAILVENMNDLPYLRRHVGPEIVAAMTAATLRVVESVTIPVGVQVLAGANSAALSVALAAGASFIRAEGFVFAAVADEGLLDEADAGPLLRFRRSIGAAHIPILADIRKKHTSHAITGDLSIGAWSDAAAFAGADAVVVTGAVTGAETEIVDLAAARRGGSLPVGIGSGLTPANAPALLREADFAIVGSWNKHDGDWRRPVDVERARAIVRATNADTTR